MRASASCILVFDEFLCLRRRYAPHISYHMRGERTIWIIPYVIHRDLYSRSFFSIISMSPAVSSDTSSASQAAYMIRIRFVKTPPFHHLPSLIFFRLSASGYRQPRATLLRAFSPVMSSLLTFTEYTGLLVAITSPFLSSMSPLGAVSYTALSETSSAVSLPFFVLHHSEKKQPETQQKSESSQDRRTIHVWVFSVLT